MEFRESHTVYRLIIQHPVPWRYKSPGTILDAEDNVVAQEESIGGKIPQVLFDFIWATYWEFLQPSNPENTNSY
jgi:hypothetical protein